MLFTVLVFTCAFLSRKSYSCPIEKWPCTTANGTQGYCVPSQYCPYINSVIGSTTPSELEFVNNSICGYDIDKTTLYCCDINGLQIEAHRNTPKRPESFISTQKVSNTQKLDVAITLSASTVQVEKPVITASLPQSHLPLPKPVYCQTPSGDRAQCVSLYECPIMYAILYNTTNADRVRYLRESKCGFSNGTVLVCCGSDVNVKNFVEDEENRNFTYNYLVPRINCGLQSIITARGYQPLTIESRAGPSPNMNFTLPNRIFGGQDAGIGEFPWLALLEYEILPDGNRRFHCGGSLITSKYVLTAAHCLLVRPGQQLVNIRLGEWNHNNQGPACVLTSSGKICTEAPINVGFASLHPHPEYRVEIREKYHDIGLIRLERDILFTDHIRPICLPSPHDYLTPGERLTISGWGLKNFNEETSIKQKVDVPVIAISQCSIMFEQSRQLNKLGTRQFCAGGEAGKDACAGDSGTPLMKLSTSDSLARWYVEGVVSFGHGCGLPDRYGVYTKVSKYLSWIHRTIVP